jgi:hypothetical protein
MQQLPYPILPTNPLPSQGNSAAFREFAWRFTNIIGRAVVALGRRPDYRQITRYINNIEPLLVEYYRHWLAEAAPKGWERDVMERAANVNDKNLPFELKGRSHEVIALVQYAKENGLYDAVADGLCSAFEYDPCGGADSGGADLRIAGAGRTRRRHGPARPSPLGRRAGARAGLSSSKARNRTVLGAALDHLSRLAHDGSPERCHCSVCGFIRFRLDGERGDF